MAKKILLIVALVCMVVPFMVLGCTASAESFNQRIDIRGLDWSKLSNLRIIVYDSSTGVSEFFSWIRGDFDISSLTGLRGITLQSISLSPTVYVSFGVQLLDQYASDMTYVFSSLKSVSSFDSSSESFLGVPGGATVNMFPVPAGSYASLICEFVSFDRSSSYAEGVQAGIQQANNTVNKNSASYQQGLTDGRADASEYTFLGLIGAVLDAPINALFGYTSADGVFHPGLFSIEILGMNMSAFILSIFTLGLIIAILRLCLGGK